MRKESLTHTIKADRNERLDKCLHRILGGSRNQVEQLIKKGFVSVSGKPVTKAGHKVCEGDLVTYELPTPSPKQYGVVDFDVTVLYEDDDILVIDKPSGLVVHPAPSVKEATLVDWLKAKGISLSTISGDERHGIVHRLDKDTSGVMVVAKNNAAHEKLAEQLQDKTMGRYYLALINMPLKRSGYVEKPIGRNPSNRLKMGVVPSGRNAKTYFEKLLTDERSRYELIGAKLFTGRTHQIRVHLASMSRHIVGDGLYGFKSRKDTIERILLHAYILYLVHPRTGQRMQFKAPVPLVMREVLERYFTKESLDEVMDPCRFLYRFGDHCDRMRIQGVDRTHG